MVNNDEHIIKCSICDRGLIVKDVVNDGMAFLSHLKFDHGIVYTFQRIVAEKRGSHTTSNTLQDQRFMSLE